MEEMPSNRISNVGLIALYDLYLPPAFERWAIATRLEGDEASMGKRQIAGRRPFFTLSLVSQSRVLVYQIVTTIIDALDQMFQTFY
jgi:hypothetical protein